MRKQNPFDAESVRELAKLLAETDLTEIEVQKGDMRVRVARNISVTVAAQAMPVASAPIAGAEAHAQPGGAAPSPRTMPPARRTRHGHLADGRHRLSRARARTRSPSSRSAPR